MAFIGGFEHFQLLLLLFLLAVLEKMNCKLQDKSLDLLLLFPPKGHGPQIKNMINKHFIRKQKIDWIEFEILFKNYLQPVRFNNLYGNGLLRDFDGLQYNI